MMPGLTMANDHGTEGAVGFSHDLSRDNADQPQRGENSRQSPNRAYGSANGPCRFQPGCMIKERNGVHKVTDLHSYLEDIIHNLNVCLVECLIVQGCFEEWEFVEHLFKLVIFIRN